MADVLILSDEKLELVKLLCEENDIDKLYFFGSSVNGKFKIGKSDIDVYMKIPSRFIENIVNIEIGLRRIFNTQIDIFIEGWGLDKEIKDYIFENKKLIYSKNSG